MPAMQHNISLKDRNSLGIEIKAALYAIPETRQDLTQLLGHYDFKNLPFLIMGEGSNLLFKSDFEGLVLNPRIRGIELVEDKVCAEIRGFWSCVVSSAAARLFLNCFVLSYFW